jgi:hypothetical protein
MSRKSSVDSTTIMSILLLIMCCVGLFYFVFTSNSQVTAEAGKSMTRDPVVGVLSLIAAAASFWNTLSFRRNARDIEELKQQLGSKFPALKESRKAALRYYRTLSKMEIGSFTGEDYQNSEKVMSDAESDIYFLNQEYQDRWYTYWQAARVISESAANKSANESREEWKNSWARQLSEKLDDVTSFEMNV